MTLTLKAVKTKLLEELRLDVYLKKSFGSNNHYEQGREDTTRNHLVLLGHKKAKLMTVKDIDELMKYEVVCDWWDALTDEEQLKALLDWYPNEITKDTDIDKFFGDIGSERQLWIYQRENKCTEEDMEAKEDFICDLEFERRWVEGDEIL